MEYKEVVDVSRIRRITGYLTGDVSRWGNSKRAELDDRVCHNGRVGKHSSVVKDEKYEKELSKLNYKVQVEK